MNQNRLQYEKSPYLLQHAGNPVDWYAWGSEAFERSEKENKPIFLSIGYSTCHWCHVMERECFEDEEVANLMNEAFVSIKVDREERPDIDNLYMAVCQMMIPHCGWPLNIIMTPDRKPFFACTYVPKTSHSGRLGMLDLVPHISKLWQDKHQDILSSAEEITGYLQNTSSGMSGGDLDASLLDKAYGEIRQRFDTEYGGFLPVPKFPSPHNLLFLLRYWKRKGEKYALGIVERTLHEMSKGGIFDHIGFGFHRYSTDETWLLPHFEKMLYDQAMLAMAYTETYQATQKEEYAQTAHNIFTYVLRDMTSPEGGFLSAEDADSEGEEGKFYVWSKDELKAILDPDEFDFIIKTFQVKNERNFKDEATGGRMGDNILHLDHSKSYEEMADSLGLSEDDYFKRRESLREKLFRIREKRVHPYLDDKVLTDWNGLMIAALAKGFWVLGEAKYAGAAERAVEFIYDKLHSKDGRLLHRYRDGDSAINGHLTDYTFMIWGLIELFEATYNGDYLAKALKLNDILIQSFWDKENGGFYFTANDGEELISRTKEIYDGAIPSGNSVAMLNLLRLARITGDSSLEAMANKVAKGSSEAYKSHPSQYTQLMNALDFAEGPSYEIVIVGNIGSEDTQAMINSLRNQYLPNKVLLIKSNGHSLSGLVPFIEPMKSLDGKATAYVCMNYACQNPTTEIHTMLELLSQDKR